MAEKRWFYVSYKYGSNNYGANLYLDAYSTDSDIERELRAKHRCTGNGLEIIEIKRK